MAARDTGYTKPTIFDPIGKLQTPSNVTRLSRSLRHICTDGTMQVIEYHSGVGTGDTWSEVVSGGAFGLGISEGSKKSARGNTAVGNANSRVEHTFRVLLHLR